MKDFFDHRRPITCADRKPIQYGVTHGQHFRAGASWRNFSAEEDKTLLRMRLDGHTWAEIAAAIGRNYGADTYCASALHQRAARLSAWERVWGDRRPLPEDVAEMARELKRRGPEIAARLMVERARTPKALKKNAETNNRRWAQMKEATK